MESSKYLILSYLILFIIGLSDANYLVAQNKDSVSTGDPIHFGADFFDQEQPLEIELAFNIKELTSKKQSEDYLTGTFTIIDDSIKISKPVKIRPRGNVRKEICYFPPYILNFKKSDITDDLPSDMDKIKVVAHCVKSNEYTNYVFKEFLAYKLFNIITENSFKVRLAKITYIDTGRKNKASDEWAFLIEPENMLAERLNSVPIEQDNMSHTYLDSLQSTKMVFFQYMIGNTDFSLTGRHNLKLIKSKDFQKNLLTPIPFDFDYSGLVNAHYALPMNGLPIHSVTERYYNGMCRGDSLYMEVIKFYLAKEVEILNYINTCTYLDKGTRNYVTYYINGFYKELKKPDFIEYYIRSTCF